ncbi:MAG TPA: dihydropteroate synthase [Solirubrobacteraceae bacterium]|nr:dihydropteroate synthase [Solirubrobacteraceae bacterium]
MTRLRLCAGDRVLDLGARPWLMGVVNASPDSFSDGGRYGSLAERVELALAQVAAGADILDIGGESATTGRPPVPAAEEIERVVPLIERIVAELESDRARHPAGEGRIHPVVSIDTYKPPVARAAIAAGARIVNDVSGLRDPELAAVCAESGAALVLMHTAAAPRVRRQDPDLYGDVVEEVLDFLRERVAVALGAGVSREQLILDPGPDFAKTPAQTIALLAHVERLHELGLPLLLAISRKDFIGALTGRPPRERLAGTLAALAHGVDAGAHIFRVHDVAAAVDFLTVRAALAGERPVKRDLALTEELRHQHAPRGSTAPESIRP